MLPHRRIAPRHPYRLATLGTSPNGGSLYYGTFSQLLYMKGRLCGAGPAFGEGKFREKRRLGGSRSGACVRYGLDEFPGLGRDAGVIAGLGRAGQAAAG